MGWSHNITEIVHTYILSYQTTERCFEDWSQQAKGWLQATKHNRFNHKKCTQFYTNVQHYFCWKTFDILPGKLKGFHHDKKRKRLLTTHLDMLNSCLNFELILDSHCDFMNFWRKIRLLWEFGIWQFLKYNEISI